MQGHRRQCAYIQQHSYRTYSQAWLPDNTLSLQEKRKGFLKGLDSVAKTVNDKKTNTSERTWEVLRSIPLGLCQGYVYIVISVAGTLLKVSMTRRLFSNHPQILQHLICFYTSHCLPSLNKNRNSPCLRWQAAHVCLYHDYF